MNLSHADGVPPPEAEAVRVLHRALDLGVRHFAAAQLCGFGRNVTLLGKALRDRRGDLHLASNCGMTGMDGKRVIDGRPATLHRIVDQSLRAMQTDHIDLCYLHRLDLAVPVGDSIGAMARMVDQGKVGALGLSEVSAATLARAHVEHPIDRVLTAVFAVDTHRGDRRARCLPSNRRGIRRLLAAGSRYSEAVQRDIDTEAF